MLWTQKNPFDSRRFFAMRSWVDLPDQSDHSTMMRVPGRSSVEKNISFFAEVSAFFAGDAFFWVTIGEYINIYFQYRKNKTTVKRSRIFHLAISKKSVIDTFLYTKYMAYFSLKIVFKIENGIYPYVYIDNSFIVSFFDPLWIRIMLIIWHQ